MYDNIHPNVMYGFNIPKTPQQVFDELRTYNESDIGRLDTRLEEWLDSEEGKARFLEALHRGNPILERFRKARTLDADFLREPFGVV